MVLYKHIPSKEYAMLIISAKTPTQNLPIKRSMSKLFQSFLYVHIPSNEHKGYISKSGKTFKSMNFFISYQDNFFKILFTALDEKYEQSIALEILKNGLKLGEVHISSISVEIVKREVEDGINEIEVQGYICASIKNPLTKRKIFLEPGDKRHTEIITNHSLEKYETLLGSSYDKDLLIAPLWQSYKPMIFWYEKTPYTTWKARYKIYADSSMLNLLLKTGLGGDSMKNMGFLEIVR